VGACWHLSFVRTLTSSRPLPFFSLRVRLDAIPFIYSWGRKLGLAIRYVYMRGQGYHLLIVRRRDGRIGPAKGLLYTLSSATVLLMINYSGPGYSSHVMVLDLNKSAKSPPPRIKSETPSSPPPLSPSSSYSSSSHFSRSSSISSASSSGSSLFGSDRGSLSPSTAYSSRTHILLFTWVNSMLNEVQ
jgi:hypothetical protein